MTERHQAILATLCYVRSEGKTLMIHRVKKQNDDHAGKWNGLGGKLESGESPEECAIREMKEETGLTIRNPELKGILTFPEFANGRDWYVFVFVIRDFEGELIDSPEGNLAWIEDEKLLELNLWEGDAVFMKRLDEPGIFSGKFMYEDGRLKSYTIISHA
jgi:8-oxo-dGTP diphosphatase